jgi:uncharacterized protein
MPLELAVVAVAVGATAQSISGIGFALVASPFLVATLGASEGVRTALVLSTLVNVCVLAREYRCVAWRSGMESAQAPGSWGVQRLACRWWCGYLGMPRWYPR